MVLFDLCWLKRDKGVIHTQYHNNIISLLRRPAARTARPSMECVHGGHVGGAKQ